MIVVLPEFAAAAGVNFESRFIGLMLVLSVKSWQLLLSSVTVAAATAFPDAVIMMFAAEEFLMLLS